MKRRLHVPVLKQGRWPLPPDQSHYIRNVLRLIEGQKVEIFDNAGRTAEAMLVDVTSGPVMVEVGAVLAATAAALSWTVVAAVPKGARADWMVEKLSEIGTARFIPLAAQRSVVLPEGSSKMQRWQRLAQESARQSHRRGVMHIDDLLDLPSALRKLAGEHVPGWYFSTGAGALPAWRAVEKLRADPPGQLALLIGPEGGWTPEEEELLEEARLTAVSLGATILRVETAAIAAAALVAAMVAPTLAPVPDPGDDS